MKTIAERITHDGLEREILRRDRELRDCAKRYGKYHALKAPPAPGKETDTLAPFIGELRAGYAMLLALVHQHLQPDTQIENANRFSKAACDHIATIDRKISQLDEEGRRSMLEETEKQSLSEYVVVIGSFLFKAIITAGEVVFLTSTFQVTGSTFLDSFVWAVALGVVVFVLADVTALLWLKPKRIIYKILFATMALTGMTLLFSVIAGLRSRAMGLHNVDISPNVFVIINLAFFTASVFLSMVLTQMFDTIPSLSAQARQTYRTMSRALQKRILEHRRERIMRKSYDGVQAAKAIGNYAAHLENWIESLSLESIEIFKTTNLLYRNDGGVPDCFCKPHPELPPVNTTPDLKGE